MISFGDTLETVRKGSAGSQTDSVCMPEEEQLHTYTPHVCVSVGIGGALDLVLIRANSLNSWTKQTIGHVFLDGDRWTPPAALLRDCGQNRSLSFLIGAVILLSELTKDGEYQSSLPLLSHL